MIDIDGDTLYFDVQRTTQYGPMGRPELQIMIRPSYRLMDIDADVHDLKDWMIHEKLRRTEEQSLLATHPGLKDLHDQYKIMLNLVKQTPKVPQE